MLSHLSVPKVLFSFSILPCRCIPYCSLSYLSIQLLLPASMINNNNNYNNINNNNNEVH